MKLGDDAARASDDVDLGEEVGLGLDGTAVDDLVGKCRARLLGEGPRGR